MRLIPADNYSQVGLITQLHQRRSHIAAHRAALTTNTTLPVLFVDLDHAENDAGAASADRVDLLLGNCCPFCELN